MSNDVLIIDGARTPMGGMLGALAPVAAPELAAVAARATLERAGVAGSDVDEVFMGCVLPAGLKQCPRARRPSPAAFP
jgi:acetyl-CoA C-acetyltransferase